MTDKKETKPGDNKPKQVHYQSYQEFYEEIPEEGSLGILAMGFQGILAWRRKREELKAARGETSTPETTEVTDG
ncbi:hypothetical protein HQ585_12715 [candidate division KSB1 bacterium]|nr:hypothetical protein [candidate division KSB1 bacterium]